MSGQITIHSICLGPKCYECDNVAAKIEIVEPNRYPKKVNEWDKKRLHQYQKYRNFESIYLLYSGPGGSNGNIGIPIDVDRKFGLISAFTPPYHPNQIRDQFYDMAGYCTACDKFYCNVHWSSSSLGYGKCPKGHGQSLDPHWSPEY